MKYRYVFLNFAAIFLVLYMLFALVSGSYLGPVEAAVLLFVSAICCAVNLLILVLWVGREGIYFLTKDTVVELFEDNK